jgi:uncharacterized protein YifN (PemK superfamily)
MENHQLSSGTKLHRCLPHIAIGQMQDVLIRAFESFHQTRVFW